MRRFVVFLLAGGLLSSLGGLHLLPVTGTMRERSLPDRNFWDKRRPLRRWEEERARQ